MRRKRAHGYSEIYFYHTLLLGEVFEISWFANTVRICGLKNSWIFITYTKLYNILSWIVYIIYMLHFRKNQAGYTECLYNKILRFFLKIGSFNKNAFAKISFSMIIIINNRVNSYCFSYQNVLETFFKLNNKFLFKFCP